MSALELVPRECSWCEGPIPTGARRDAKYCSKRCRQAAHRFQRGCVERARAATPMRLAYADPPYPGLAKRYYAEHPDFAGEVDHDELVRHLASTYDGWALSTSALALPKILARCVAEDLDVRVAIWHRGARPGSSRWPRNAYEPVVYAGGRRLARDDQPDDVLTYHARPRTTDPRRVIGTKPAEFLWWLIDLLDARPGDQLDDLFPGSGGLERAWRIYVGREAHVRAGSPVGEQHTSPRAQDDRSRHAGDARPVAAIACEQLELRVVA